VDYVPGGCSYNAMRIFNWMVDDKDNSNKTGLLGSVGDDFYGDLYASLLEKEEIVPLFEKYNDTNTGICGVFCHNRDRGHITDLGASIKISGEFVKRIWEEIENVQLIYTELFILKHKKDIVYQLAEHCTKIDKIFGFNLPSFYFLETFYEDITKLLDYVDVLFANAAEARFLANLMGINYNEDDLGDLCKQFSRRKNKMNKDKKTVVVITCGPNPAFVAEYNPNLDSITFFGSYSPVNVDEESIVDTNGAGDSFAGGFLSRFVKGASIEDCMSAGHWAASIIIQMRGCKIPNDLRYKGF